MMHEPDCDPGDCTDTYATWADAWAAGVEHAERQRQDRLEAAQRWSRAWKRAARENRDAYHECMSVSADDEGWRIQERLRWIEETDRLQAEVTRLRAALIAAPEAHFLDCYVMQDGFEVLAECAPSCPARLRREALEAVEAGEQEQST